MFKPKIKKEKKRMKQRLEALREAVVEINTKIEILESQVGGLPTDLAANLAALRADVDTNTGDISLALTLNDIIGILMDVESIRGDLSTHGGQIDNLESVVADLTESIARLDSIVGDHELRLMELEVPGSPNEPGTVFFTGDFIVVTDSDPDTITAWDEFRNNATGFFTSIEIKSSLGMGESVKCSNPVKSTNIAYALRNHTIGAFFTSNCEGQDWNVGFCRGVELNAGPDSDVCQCDLRAAVRPSNGRNWGGIGDTCGADSQTLEVILTR